MTILDDARPGMDLAIRPQDDLFGHVNGTWLAETEIPSDRSSWGPFVMLADAAEQHVRTIIEECAGSGGDGGSEGDVRRKIGDLFASFMDEDRIEELGAEPILPLLAEVEKLGDLRELAAYLGRHERTGGSGLFGTYIDTDAKDSDRYIVNLVQGGLSLPDESHYRDEKFAETRAKYVDYLTRMFKLVGRAEPAADAATVVRVETRLAQGHWERAETRDVQKTYNLRTLAEVEQLCPSFDWRGWVAALGGDETTLAECTVRQPSYFEHLESVLGELTLDELRVWLTARVVRNAAAYLSTEFVETNFDFYGRTLAGTPELRARWKRGVALVESALGEAVGELYVERHFPPRSKELMDALVDNLLEAYRRSITDLDWMSEETKQRAFEKLATFRPKIGYPEKFRDYSALEVRADDLIANVRASAAFETDRELRKIGSPVDRDEWFMLPQTVNAYYNPGTNEICFPAGILQKPFFDPDADPAENYGGIGAVIGHEIGHGFDDQGAQYDGAGNLNDWWTPEDKERFGERSAMLIEQYDGLEPRNLPGERVNGSLTVGENIGDLGGVTIALKAYRISLESTPEHLPDGPERDGETGVQRLFLNWAYVWRTKRREELDRQYLTIDPHSPPEFRANIVRNLDEFHAAFGTEPGDGLWLDPEERVRIW
ncbi:M13 family metallopeptidase [Nocardioides massiliensis]|uniref:Endothelin-converting enzyme/putative endopeptidase n=1 Tax=Nocardioides massiliensis TaxID=1325935 RepID=A0ABT9NLF5_9ACTN|nr:M13-type metalloendopeptidase [Nocardioides massiliensis]MDP9821257.1 endothelin-converting enzyme/putative endopeptidase [Nocardioides massiliensis]